MNYLTYRDVLKLAIPASIASLVTPLLGLIDAAVLGYSPRPYDVGAVGLAAAIFSLAYWTFGFLRMSTAGLTAQAIGANDAAKARRTLIHSVMLGGLVGFLITTFQSPFGNLAFSVMTNGATVEAATIEAAREYYAIRIWGAPFALMTYGALGWLTARGRTDLLMAIVATMTFLNMGLDILFVMHYQWGASGIAAGTLIAEITGALLTLLAVLYMLHQHDGVKAHWHQIDYFSTNAIRRLLIVNVDIFIRTLILVATFAYFIQRSSTYGDVTLSANQLLLQFFLVTGLALDGAAIAAETLVGQALGNKNEMTRRARFFAAAKKSSIIAGLGASAMCVLYILLGDSLINMTSPDPIINDAARSYFLWIIISPLVVAAAFQLDGIYIGATRSKALRNSMIISGGIYLLTVNYLAPSLGNHGLWLSFGIFMVVRAITLAVAWPGFGPLLQQGQQHED